MQETQPVGFASQTKSKNKIKPIPETTSCKFMLTKYLAEQITYLEGHLKFLKKELPEYWENANPNDSTSWPYFHALNKIKDEQRYIKKQLQKLRYIQKVIKLFPDNDLTLEYAKGYKEDLDLWKIIDQERKPKKLDSRKVS
jgi:hypothetical protein